MLIHRFRFYFLLLTACLAGYIWLYLSSTAHGNETHAIEACFLKHLANIPCPSCGSTRSILSLLNGDFFHSFYLNPLGLVVAVIMFLSPAWMLWDLITRKASLLNFYIKVECKLKRPAYAAPLALLLIMNWFWNIKKGL